jgi:hypothetical protein
MRAAFHVLAVSAISISLLALFTPAMRAVALPPKADCCAKMNMGGGHGDCGGKAPQSKEDRQCCAACAHGLTPLVNAAKPLLYPPRPEKWNANYFVGPHFRSERPPVPPPRDLSI